MITIQISLNEKTDNLGKRKLVDQEGKLILEAVVMRSTYSFEGLPEIDPIEILFAAGTNEKDRKESILEELIERYQGGQNETK